MATHHCRATAAGQVGLKASGWGVLKAMEEMEAAACMTLVRVPQLHWARLTHAAAGLQLPVLLIVPVAAAPCCSLLLPQVERPHPGVPVTCWACGVAAALHR